MSQIFIDGDFNNIYESRIRASKGENKHKVQCPECLEWIEKEELEMFNGFCETCTEEL